MGESLLRGPVFEPGGSRQVDQALAREAARPDTGAATPLAMRRGEEADLERIAPLRPYPTTARIHAPRATPRRKFPRRLLLRFAAMYFLFFALPFPLSLVPDPRALEGSFGARWTWVETVRPFYEGLDAAVAWTRTVEERAVDTTASRVFGLELAPGASALRDDVRLLLVGLLALACSVSWTLAAGRGGRGGRDLAPWLHLAGRYFLGMTLLRLGIADLLGVTPHAANDLWEGSGGALGAGTQAGAGAWAVLAGACLCFRRTATLGGIAAVGVVLAAMWPQLALGAAPDLRSLHLVLLAGALCLPDLGRLADVLVMNRPTRPRDLSRPDVPVVGLLAKLLILVPFVVLQVQHGLTSDPGAELHAHAGSNGTLPVEGREESPSRAAPGER